MQLYIVILHNILIICNSLKRKRNIIFSYSNPDDIHNMIDDIATSQNLTREITEAICNPTRLDSDEDEVRKVIFA